MDKRGYASMKPSNPKDAIAGGKVPLELFPTTAAAYGSVALFEGAIKYGRANWREAGVRASVYIGACKRHLDKWAEGDDVDPVSRVPHLANALACIAIVIDALEAGKLVDDRHYPGPDLEGLLNRFESTITHLKTLHGDKTPIHYTRELKHD